MNVAALLESSLLSRWGAFLLQVRRTRRRCSEPAIHDLRVATRRLIATLEIIGRVTPGGGVSRVRRHLKRLLKSFNELRDVHIQILAVRLVVRPFPVLRFYRAALMVRKQRLVREAGRRVAGIELESLSREIAGVQADLQSVFSKPGMMNAGEWLVRGAVASTFARAVRLRWDIVPSQVRTIHRLRVAFKKFRYSCEVLQPMIPWVGKDHLKAMNAYQTSMGEIQDAEVFVTGVREFARSAVAAFPSSWLPVMQDLTRRRAVRIEAFMKQVDALYMFWDASASPKELDSRQTTRRRRL